MILQLHKESGTIMLIFIEALTLLSAHARYYFLGAALIKPKANKVTTRGYNIV